MVSPSQPQQVANALDRAILSALPKVVPIVQADKATMSSICFSLVFFLFLFFSESLRRLPFPLLRNWFQAAANCK